MRIFLFILFQIAILSSCDVNTSRKEPDCCCGLFEIKDDSGNRNAQNQAFTDTNIVIFMDTANLKPFDKEKQKLIDWEDDSRAKAYEKMTKKGGYIWFTERENPALLIDKTSGDTVLFDSYDSEISNSLEPRFNERVKILIHVCIHWTGKIVYVELIRYENLQRKESSAGDIEEELKRINWKDLKVIPEKHYGIEVTSLHTLVIGFEE